MSSSFPSWTNDRADGQTPQEDKFDPSFARHASGPEGSEAYPTVEDVTAAAVATAQRQGARKGGRRSGSGREGSGDEADGPTHEDQVRAAQEAVAVGLSQQQEYSQEEKLAAVAAQRGGNSPLDSDGEVSGSKLARASGTKRAIQNRNAQRAFRQRKEKYVKDLEAKAAEVEHLKQSMEELRAENLQLRDYTLALQSRVIELSPSGPTVAPSGSAVQGGSDSNIMPTPPAVFHPKHDK